MSQTNMLLTNSEKAQLKKAFEGGKLSVVEIGYKYNLNENQVRGLASRNGWKRPARKAKSKAKKKQSSFM